jgi:diguanylate cyclase
MAEQFCAQLREPFVVGTERVQVSGRAGVVPDVRRRGSATVVLRLAGIALELAKERHRDYVVFAEGDDQTATQSRALEDLLRAAVTSDTLHAVFQPILDLRSRQVVSAEALVRLRDNTGGLVPPTVFLPLAEQLELMDRITVQMLERAVAATAGWVADGQRLSVAFNTPPTWLTGGAVATITDALDRHRVPHDLLTVEVTENEMVTMSPEGLAVLAELRRRGCHVAIDDFGTGYAGLSAFREVPADIVKIDRSFVVDIEARTEDRELLTSLIELVHRFGKTVVAEGVETAEQGRILLSMGCDRVQGYHFSPPVDLAQFPLDGAGGPEGASSRPPA